MATIRAARRTARLSLVSALAVVLASACSVESPRDGATVGQGGQPGLQGQPGQPTTGTTQAGGTGAGTGGTTGATGGFATDGTGTVATSGTAATGATSGTGGTTGTAGSGSTGAISGTGGTGGGTSVGITKDTIKLGFSGDYEGPYQAFFNQYYDDGIKVWEKDVNDRGGIFGRKVIVAKLNSRGSASGGIEACQQALRQGLFMVYSVYGLNGADVNQANCLDRAGVPFFMEQPSTVNATWRSVYVGITPQGYAAPTAGFIKRVIKDKPPLGKSKIQVGVLYAADTLGRSRRAGFVSAAKVEGLDIVAQESYEPGAQSLSPQVRRIQERGATTVAFFGGIEYLSAYRDATAIGYRPIWTGVDIAADEGPQICYPCFENLKSHRWVPTTESAAYKRFVQISQAQGGHPNVSTTTSGYFGLSLLIERVLRELGSSPTREGVGGVFDRLGHYFNGLMGVTFSRGRRTAEPDLFPVVCCHSPADPTFRPLGPAKKAF